MVCLYEYIEMCKYLLEWYLDFNVKSIEKGWLIVYFVVGNGNKKGKEIELFEMFINVERLVVMMLFIVNGNFVLIFVIKYNVYSFVNYFLVKCFNLLEI